MLCYLKGFPWILLLSMSVTGVIFISHSKKRLLLANSYHQFGRFFFFYADLRVNDKIQSGNIFVIIKVVTTTVTHSVLSFWETCLGEIYWLYISFRIWLQEKCTACVEQINKPNRLEHKGRTFFWNSPPCMFPDKTRREKNIYLTCYYCLYFWKAQRLLLSSLLLFLL